GPDRYGLPKRSFESSVGLRGHAEQVLAFAGVRGEVVSFECPGVGGPDERARLDLNSPRDRASSVRTEDRRFSGEEDRGVAKATAGPSEPGLEGEVAIRDLREEIGKVHGLQWRADLPGVQASIEEQGRNVQLFDVEGMAVPA